jgi:hypothetical protein
MSEQPFESAEPAATPPGIPPSGPPPGPPFDQPPPKAEKPRWKQVAIMFFGGLVLAAGGCAMFLATFNVHGESPVGIAGALIFLAGVLVLAVGGITGLVYMLQALFRSGKR